jgi:hypothetical protein
MQKLHPGQRYYLTNLQAFKLDPQSVRQWADDLWLFPYYTNTRFVPYDARPGNAASAAWPNQVVTAKGLATEPGAGDRRAGFSMSLVAAGTAAGVVVGILVGLAAGLLLRRKARRSAPETQAASQPPEPDGTGAGNQ